MSSTKGRCNTNERGSAADRRARKLWLLDRYGDGEKAPCWECAVVVDYETMIVDRIVPGERGGRYTRTNIRVHCVPCSGRQGQARTTALVARRRARKTTTRGRTTMRMHSDVLTVNDFYAAARRAGITVVACNEHGSRSRERAFEIAFSGSGVSGGQWGGGGYKSATWDEWGIALDYLFTLDPAAHCGKDSYQCREHFRWLTGMRFDDLNPSEQHYRHRWADYTVHGNGLWASVQCSCGAVQRWPLGTLARADWLTVREQIVKSVLDKSR